MPKRRPNAEDRSIADFIRRMPIGSRYSVVVDPEEQGMQFFGLAKLKSEGMCEITMEGKVITITPVGEKK